MAKTYAAHCMCMDESIVQTASLLSSFVNFFFSSLFSTVSPRAIESPLGGVS